MSVGVPGQCDGVLFLTCQTITPEMLFSNGLNQNIIIFYRLFALLGYKPYLLVNGPMDNNKMPAAFQDLRWITIEKFIQKPLKVKAMLEIGLNMSNKVRDVLHMMGARVLKIYLGNSLNIDTEFSMTNSDVILHAPGDVDMVLTSPHYSSQMEYLAGINRVPLDKVGIAPYVWDPMIINCYEEVTFSGQVEDIVIVEPNISFQKCCVIPLLICEKYYLEHGFKGNVHVYNTDKYNEGSNFFKNILENLALWRDGRIVLHGRHSITDILKEHPSSALLCHQTSNEYNYMYFECLHMGFPLIHNSYAWSTMGFYYENDSLKGGVEALIAAFAGASAEKGHKIMYDHSIYNPAVQEAWVRLLEGVVEVSDK
jgi:hypothetical protein